VRKSWIDVNVPITLDSPFVPICSVTQYSFRNFIVPDFPN
jgi:hypothetical protein